MRAFLSGIIALAFTALAACSPTSGALGPVDVDPAAVEAMTAKLVSEPFKSDGKAAADLDALRAALPKEIAVSWGTLTFDAVTGATIVKDLKLTPAGRADVGFSISELRLWDFHVDAAKARLAGQQTTETLKLARRIDAKGIAGFGLAGFFNELLGAYAGAGEPVAIDPAPAPGTGQPAHPDGWPADTVQEFQFGGSAAAPTATRVDISYGRVVLDDVVLRALPPPPKGTPAPITPVMPEAVTGYMTFMSSLGVDTAAMNDLKMDIGIDIQGQPMTVSAAMKTSGTRGWRGSDSDASFLRDLSFSVGIGEGGVMPAGSFDVSYGLITLEDSRLNKYVAYTEAGITPPVTETDFMSFGKFHTQNGAWKLNGKTLVSIGEATIDARNFYWTMPTNISASGRNVTVDLGAMMEFAAPAADYFTAMAGSFTELQPDTDDPTDTPAPDVVQAPAGPSPSDIIRQVAAAFEKNGMSKPNLSYDVGYTWNPDSGDARVNFAVGTDTFMKIDGAYGMGLPAFKEIAGLKPRTPGVTDPLQVMELFEKRASLKGMDLNLDDKGGLDKLYSLLADLSVSLGPTMGDGMIPPGGMTKENLRLMAGAGLMAFGGASPDLGAFFNPIGQFFQTGGKLHLEMKPSKPIGFSDAGNVLGSAGDPGAALKQLGVKAEHSGGKK